MKPNSRCTCFVFLIACLIALIPYPCQGQERWPENRFASYPPVKTPTSGIAWPKGQALPTFATPAETLDTIEVQSLTRDEQLTFVALQGLMNRQQPRILLQDARADQGRDTWPETKSIGLGTLRRFDYRNKYELLAKYAKELDGVVLYDTEISPHHRNLASTVAGVKRLLPVSPRVLENLRENGIELEVVVDLTDLEVESPIEVYSYLYDTYWPDCEKRFVVSARPHDRGGDLHHTRDLAAACGAAVIWLDGRIPAERNLMRKFLADMKPGEAVVLGWYTTERSGITTASEFAIGTLPADHYQNATVYSGGDHRIRIPSVPKMPQLDDKIYVTLFVSDGDNIQYNQRTMRKVWDASIRDRGKVPLSWTISPSLVDVGPGILNYYYETATPSDCFVTGPSGMGYMIPFNTLTERGAKVEEVANDPEQLAGYAQLTETYLQRSGLRCITIWDEASAWQRATYEKHCRQLYGATVQNFRDVPSVASSVVGERVRFEKLVIPYATTYDHLQRSLREEIAKWDRNGPHFLAYQVNIWKEMKPRRILQLVNELQQEFPGQIEFVRADHFFNLSNQAHNLTFNLALHPETQIAASDQTSDPKLAIDGTPSTVWTSNAEVGNPLTIDFGDTYEVNRFVIRHAGASGLDASLNSKSFTMKLSRDATDWKSVIREDDNTSSVGDYEFKPIVARYARIEINDAGSDDQVRIADIELFGTTIEP